MKPILMRTVVWVVVLVSVPACADTLTLTGTLLTPESVIEDGMLVIEDQQISDLGKDIGPPSGTRVIKTDGIILPGFVDLHNHLTWNVFPRWRPARKFSNRYEWQDVAEYDRILRTPQSRLIADGLGCDANLFAEVKAIIGGATSVVGSFSGRRDHPGENKCIDGLARNLDFSPGFPPYPPGPVHCTGDNSGFPPGSPGVVANEVFPFEINHERLNYYACELKNGRLRSLLIHLAEGSPSDSSAHREFRMLKSQNLLMDGLIIIHGTALTLPDFQDMREKNVGLIWSPRSNDELYGGTTNIPAAMQAGVSIAIAPDWSPTGSAGMLQELNYAATRYTFFKPEQLVAMATAVPAKMARLDDRIGKLAKGLYADLLVINPRVSKPYEAVVTATPADVRLVVVGGQPVYGDVDLLQSLLPGKTLNEFTVCGARKALYLAPPQNLTGTVPSWNDIRSRLEADLHRYGSTLSDIECD